MLPFFVGNNLVSGALVEGAPWFYRPDPLALTKLRAMPKPERKRLLQRPDTEWQVYTPVRAMVVSNPVSATNPPIGIRGFAADFDLNVPREAVLPLLEQMPVATRPTYLEISLGGRYRLVWTFAREILVVDIAHANEFLAAFAEFVNASKVFPGYDPSSEKVTQRWTNGGEWKEVTNQPVPVDILVGIAIKAAKKAQVLSSGQAEIPLDVVAAEVEKRFPGRWAGPFELDNLGVRFWDPAADAEAGAQVKPDGMLCFTGKVAFMRWTDIFGKAWCDEQGVRHTGKAANGVYFDGRNYWRFFSGQWWGTGRQDIELTLKVAGLSSRVPKGSTVSEVDKVLHYIQTEQRVVGAAPMINHRPGVVEQRGQRMLNTSTLRALEPAAVPSDFPWIRDFLWGLFARPEDKPLEHFLAWLKRSYTAFREYKPLMGQAVFLAGPAHNGKTLLNLHIAANMLGGRTGNPYPYMVGDTEFNDELFGFYLWAINDEESPATPAARAKFQARLKASVVNPTHTYHPKFQARVPLDHVGRLFSTLNDDPDSISFLPEVNPNTRDKLMFFASQAYKGAWGTNEQTEAKIAAELPHFAAWLLAWEPPAEVLEHSRVGVKSFFDRHVIDAALQQAYAFNFRELLSAWVGQAIYWSDDGVEVWEGTPTELQSMIGACEGLASPLKEWKVAQIAKALTSLARVGSSGIEHIDGSDRRFKISKSAFK